MSDVALNRLRDWGADLAIVLGSGLNALVTEAAPENRIPYADFAGLPKTSVPGHAGQFILGKIADTPVIFAQGRVHLYEGYSAGDVAAGVRLLGDTGIKRLILTNAAGSANENFSPGSWIIISDHLNLTGTSPLIGRAEFIDMTDSYSSKWRAEFRSAAKSEGLTLHEGIYAGLLGPQYETPAEVRMLRSLGADAIGMSTVIEAIQARALGLEVAGFSCLTNWAAGMGGAPLSHEDVLETGRNAAEMFARLLNAALAPA